MIDLKDAVLKAKKEYEPLHLSDAAIDVGHAWVFGTVEELDDDSLAVNKETGELFGYCPTDYPDDKHQVIRINV